MEIKRILLTGDDGYNSIGTRLLVHSLKPDFELSIIATKEQQSGVGGKVSIASGGKWGRAKVDGVPAVWLDGTPCDAMECARRFYAKPFDLIISGINLGINIGGAIISSGTFAAAYRGVCIGVAPRALAISWDVQYRLLYRNHSGSENIQKFHNYPGKIVGKLIRQAIDHNFWDSPLLNINLPAQEARRARFTQLLLNIYGYWPEAAIEKKTRRFYYPPGIPMRRARKPIFDADAIAAGDISITPCTPDFLNHNAYPKFKNTVLSL